MELNFLWPLGKVNDTGKNRPDSKLKLPSRYLHGITEKTYFRQMGNSWIKKNFWNIEMEQNTCIFCSIVIKLDDGH